MKIFFLILLFNAFSNHYLENGAEIKPAVTMDPVKKYTYLALGDSYTIGESVPATANFPSQVISLLQKDAVIMEPARIIATTGWTTDELETGIAQAQHSGSLLSTYDFVSLLIGVNNQYRGRTVENYRSEFEELLKKAIRFAGNKTDHVAVISIPDWGVTPFATGRDRAEIADAIDLYNAANKQIALQYHVHYIDITPWTREAAANPSLLTGDGLHPSEKEYTRWAIKIAAWIRWIL
jgi:lysophospholipase L1-like esterase